MTPTCADCGRTAGPIVRGLCRHCYSVHNYHGTLADYPRRTWPADELLDEWVRLRDDGTKIRDAAVRLGVTFAALRKATGRASARGDARGRRAPFGRDADHTHTDRRQQA